MDPLAARRGLRVLILALLSPWACGGGSSDASPGASASAAKAEAGAKAEAATPEATAAGGTLDPTTLPGSIFFVSERDGDLDVYRWRAGVAPERLTKEPGGDFVGEVMAEGWTRVSTVEGAAPEDHREQLWWMPHGGEPRKIGTPGRRARGASWAPQRAFVVYESDAEGGFSDLWRWSPDGTSTRLTQVKQGAFEPAVSPDGRFVAYVSSQDGNPELYRMKADGTEPRRLTDWRRDDYAPKWAPDGKRLAFLRRERGGERLFILELPEEGEPVERRLVPTKEGEKVKHAEHAWSPDGKSLAYAVHRPKELPRVVVSDAGDGTTRVVSPEHLKAVMPSWSPDGTHLAFAGAEDDPEALDLYAVTSDGSAWARLTTHAAPDWLPRWSPT